MKKKEIFKVLLNVNYYDMTLDDKLEICRKNNARWEGACMEHGITIILLSRKEASN